MKSKLELIQNIAHFYGSENLYSQNCYGKVFHITEGCHYLRENADCYWLFDAILSYQPYKDVSSMDLQVWKLKRVGLPEESDEFILTLEDGDGNQIRKQEIPYSDFPLDEIKIWVENKVIMFPSER